MILTPLKPLVRLTFSKLSLRTTWYSFASLIWPKKLSKINFSVLRFLRSAASLSLGSCFKAGGSRTPCFSQVAERAGGRSCLLPPTPLRSSEIPGNLIQIVSCNSSYFVSNDLSAWGWNTDVDIPFVDIDCTAVVGRHVAGRATALGKSFRPQATRSDRNIHNRPAESICCGLKAINLCRKAVLLVAGQDQFTIFSLYIAFIRLQRLIAYKPTCMVAAVK